jgi:phage-related protein
VVAVSGALTIGELVGFIRADDTGMRRGLAQSQLRMRGFQVDTEGRLRDLRGRFVSESQVMAMSLRDDLTGAITVANRATNQFTRDANGRLRDLNGRFVSVGNSAQTMGQQTRTALQGASRDGNRFAGVLGRIVGAAGGLARVAAGAAPIAGAIGAAVPVAAGLVATLQNIAPAAGVGVTAMLAVRQASAVVKLAAVGMDDAITAALDPSKAEEFEEALKKLSPEAKQFALAVKEAAPALRDLQQDVQNRVFRGLAEDLESAGKSALPVVRRELLATAGAVNAMGKGVVYAAQNLADSGVLGQAMGSASKGLKNLSGIPGVVVTALGQVAAAAGPSFERLTAAAGEGAAKVGAKFAKAFESGAMQEAIERAIDLIGELVDVGQNVGSIFGSIFEAADVSGGGLIGTLKTITGSLKEAFASEPVQAGLSALFETVSKLATTAGPLLGQALGVLGPVLEALGPPAQRLVQALGDALEPVIAALEPVLVAAAEAIGALVDAALPLLPVVGELAAALLPALTPLLEAIVTVFEALAPVIEETAGILMDTLAPILENLPGIIEPLAEILATTLVAGITILGGLIEELGPTLVTLGEAFGELLVAVAPLLEMIARLVVEGLALLMPVIEALLPVIAALANMLGGFLASVISGVMVPALQAVIALLQGDFSGAWEFAKQAVIGAGMAVITAVSGMATAIFDGVRRAVGYLASLPGQAIGVLGNLGGLLFSAGASLISGFISGIKSMVGAVAEAASSVVSAAREYFPFSPAKKGPFSGRGYTTHSGRALMDGFRRGIEAGMPSVQASLDRMPGLGPVLGGLGLGGGLALPGELSMAGLGAAEATRVEVINRTVLDVRGGDDEFLRMIRRWADIEGGGNVQDAFGKAAA